jgi:hypothetical protein
MIPHNSPEDIRFEKALADNHMLASSFASYIYEHIPLGTLQTCDYSFRSPELKSDNSATFFHASLGSHVTLGPDHGFIIVEEMMRD